MNDKKTTVDNLKVFVKDFVDERDWSQFHNPKNISMALAIEASELMDIFKWDSNDESEKKMTVDISRQDAIDELADVIIYSIAFANKFKSPDFSTYFPSILNSCVTFPAKFGPLSNSFDFFSSIIILST